MIILILDEQELERKLLIQTKIINSGPNAFHCADCGFTTAYKNSLVNHIEAKHVEGVYTCTKCGREYNSKVALTMHDTRSHRDKVVPIHEQFMSKIRCLDPSDFLVPIAISQVTQNKHCPAFTNKFVLSINLSFKNLTK